MMLNPYMSYPVVGGSYDADAVTYLTAVTAHVTPGSTKEAAVDALVTTIKANGHWNDLKYFRYYGWQNAGANKFNIKDPQDTDAAFRALFFGSPTHGSGGVILNGSSQWINSKMPMNTLGQNGATYGMGISGTPGSTHHALGAYSLGFTTSVLLYQNGSTNIRFAIHSNAETNVASSNIQGRTIITRTASNAIRHSKSGASGSTNTTASTSNASATVEILEGAFNYAQYGANYHMNGTILYAFAFNGGMSTTDIANMDAAIATFLTAMGH